MCVVVVVVVVVCVWGGGIMYENEGGVHEVYRLVQGSQKVTLAVRRRRRRKQQYRLRRHAAATLDATRRGDMDVGGAADRWRRRMRSKSALWRK